MASPFFSSYWNQPSESSYSPSSIPLKRKPETPSPKVISIPVHFVGSESNRSGSGLNRSDSALKIQKVFRGFLVRKCVNKIVSIKNEVEEIERKVAQNETVELIRKDSKERLRINETLMALLFKLDSIRGIDSGVRELRRGVIRKAIALQEKVDALVMLPMESASEQNEAPVDSGDIADSNRSDIGEIVDDHPVCDDVMPIESPVSIDEMPIENVIDSMDQSQDDDEEEGNCVVKEIVKECSTMNSVKEDEEMDDCCKGVQQQLEEEKETVEDKMMSEDGEKKKSNEELQIEMLRMMSELVEKNELQTQMINSLTHRVGQLEKALLCDKLRRSNKKNKKRQQHDAPADGKQH